MRPTRYQLRQSPTYPFIDTTRGKNNLACYVRKKFMRRPGIEPGPSAWKADILTTRPTTPSLSPAIPAFERSTNIIYACVQQVLGGFEPPSLDSESRVLTVTPQDRRACTWRLGLLYCESPPTKIGMDLSGFEPEAFCMQSRCDTTTPQAHAHCSTPRVPVRRRDFCLQQPRTPDSSGVRTHALSDQRLKLAP